MKPIGLQLYTLRRPFKDDPLGTLKRVRDIGYASVEFAAPIDLDFAAMGARLRDLALDCPSAHAGLADIRARPEAVLTMAAHLGCRYLVLAFVEPSQRDWPKVAATLNVFAADAQRHGIRVAYHHHDFEFEGAPGARPFDLLVAETDPTLVFFELDVYWLKKGGEDPGAAIRRLNGRVKLVHLKDMDADGAMTDVGAGTLDFPALVGAAREAGAEHYFVEHDFAPPPLWPSVEASWRYLSTLA